MEAAKIINDDAGKFLFVQGEVSIPVDPDSILKTINNLDTCNAGLWVALARNNDLPTDPFNRKLLKPVLMGVLQNSWYERFGENGIPERVSAGQKARVAKYHEDLEKFKQNPGSVDSLRTPEVKSPRTARTYRLTDSKLEEAKKFKGQKKLIIDAMISMGASGTNTGVSTATIADAIKDKLETKQPPERVVAFYMNTLAKDGVIDSPGDQANLPDTTPAAVAEPTAAEEPAAKTKAKKSSKK
jgi:hypothetical protein